MLTGEKPQDHLSVYLKSITYDSKFLLITNIRNV